VPIREILVLVVDGKMKMPMKGRAQHSALSNSDLQIEGIKKMSRWQPGYPKGLIMRGRLLPFALVYCMAKLVLLAELLK
jgi:hypothetical protein